LNPQLEPGANYDHNLITAIRNMGLTPSAQSVYGMPQPCCNHAATMLQPCRNHAATMPQPCRNHAATIAAVPVATKRGKTSF
jgi:hypothetical protein